MWPRRQHAGALIRYPRSLPGEHTTESDADWLGNILVREGHISLDQLERALAFQRETGLRLATVVVKLSMVPEETILRLLSEQYGAKLLDLASFEPNQKLVRLIPGKVARKHVVLPVGREGRTLIVAMADPTDAVAIEDVNFITRLAIQPAIASESTLLSLIDRCYPGDEDLLQERPLLDAYPSSDPATPPCPRCKTPAGDGARYCGTCGADLAGDGQEQPPRNWIAPQAADDPVIRDDVTFTAIAPLSVKPGDFLPLDVYAHVDPIDDIIQVASRELQQPIRHKSKGKVPVQQGTALVFRISVPAFEFQDQDQVLWNGKTGNATFLIPVRLGTPAGQYEGRVDILVAGISIARLLLALNVGELLPASTAVTARVTRVTSAFASYASQDRKKVLGRIQGMQKVVPELEVFLDVSSLRSGERWKERLEKEILSRDVLFLFWSPSAMASEYVNWEWRLALAHRGIDFIDPIPLESPERAPPPEELKDKHFRDWTLAFE